MSCRKTAVVLTAALRVYDFFGCSSVLKKHEAKAWKTRFCFLGRHTHRFERFSASRKGGVGWSLPLAE